MYVYVYLCMYVLYIDSCIFTKSTRWGYLQLRGIFEYFVYEFGMVNMCVLLSFRKQNKGDQI